MMSKQGNQDSKKGNPAVKTLVANQISARPQPDTSVDTWDGLARLHEVVQERATQYVHDICKKQTYLEEHIGVLSAILGSMGEALIVMDVNGKVVLSNPAADAMTKMNLHNLTHEEYAGFTKSYLPGSTTPLEFEELPAYKARHGTPCTMILFVCGIDSSEGRWLRINARPVKDDSGKLHGAVSVIQDLTETKRLTQQRDALAALVTHDLKNHISGEQQLLAMVLEGTFGTFNREQEDVLLLLESQSKRQLQMLTSMIEIYRYDVGSESLRFVDMDIEVAINNAIEEMNHAATSGKIRLALDITPNLPHISADVRAVGHVFVNLIGNAIKFTPSGGQIEVSAKLIDDKIVVDVCDSGKGIPEDELQVLFNDAWAHANSHKPFGSTGMGLYLCKRLLDAHHATVACARNSGEGTTFTVTFPPVTFKSEIID